MNKLNLQKLIDRLDNLKHRIDKDLLDEISQSLKRYQWLLSNFTTYGEQNRWRFLNYTLGTGNSIEEAIENGIEFSYEICTRMKNVKKFIEKKI